MKPPLFLIGAGFNADAAGEAGPCEIDCGYPLVSELLRVCFGRDSLPSGKSLEDLFSDAQDEHNFTPIKELVERIRVADHYLPERLSSPESKSAYKIFFERFVDGHFLTFNFDSLVEVFLFTMRKWFPQDGYGVPVQADLQPSEQYPGITELVGRSSTSLVLHLHGSLCVATQETEIRSNPDQVMRLLCSRDEPRFLFSQKPSCVISHLYEPGRPDKDFVSRVTAPIPDKSKDLIQKFVSAVYGKAVELVRASEALVAIGYSFGPHDGASYGPILDALAESDQKRLVVVSPDASLIARRIRSEYPALVIEPMDQTFKEWTTASFPGVRTG